MKKTVFILSFILAFSSIPFFSNQINDITNVKIPKFNFNKPPDISLLENRQNIIFRINFYDTNKDDKGKKINNNPIFGDIDHGWIKEKNRFEKLFISIGVASLSIGFGLLLAGIINYAVPFNATTIDGEPIENSNNVYFSLMGIGSGLMAAGMPFLLVGSIKLGLKNKPEKENKDKDETKKKEK